MKLVVKSIEMFEKAFIYVSAVFMGLLSTFVLFEVIARYIFNSPTNWANELSTYMLQFIVFFSMGYLLIQDDHIRVTFLSEKLSGLPKKILQIISNLLVIPYAYVLVFYGFKYTSNSIRLGSVSPTLLEFPLWIPYSFIAFGGALLILASICSVMKIVIGDSKVLQGEGGN